MVDLLLLESERALQFALAAHCRQLERLSFSAISPEEREAAAVLEREFRERNVWISAEEAITVGDCCRQSTDNDNVAVVNNTGPCKIMQAFAQRLLRVKSLI